MSKQTQTVVSIIQTPPLDGVARNGVYKCGGVEILYTSANTIILTGLSSKSAPVTGFMELSLDSARKLATELLAMLDGRE